MHFYTHLSKKQIMKIIASFITILMGGFIPGNEILKLQDPPKSLIVVSAAFEHEKDIPAKYTCQGDNVHPAITVQNLPDSTKSIAIIMEDQDAPNGGFDHWIAWNIAPAQMIAENSLPGITGKNSKGESSYYGPCPPRGTHFYNFKIYALDTELALTSQADRRTLEQAMQKHILAWGELTGRYKQAK